VRIHSALCAAVGVVLLMSSSQAAEPKTAEDLVTRGKTHFDKRKFDEAVADFTKAIDLDPKSAHAFLHRGIALYQMLGKRDLAIADYTKAIDLDPKLGLAFLHRGLALGPKGQWEEAVADFTKAIDLNPKDALAFYHRGLAYYVMEKYALVMYDFLESIRLDPKQVDAPFSLKVLINKLKTKSIEIKVESVALDLEVTYVVTKTAMELLDEGQSKTVGEEVTVKHEVAFSMAERVERGVKRSEKSKEESSSQNNSSDSKSANGRLSVPLLSIGGEVGNTTGETWGTIRGWESEVCTSIRTSIEQSKAWTKGIETKTKVGVTLTGRPGGQKYRVIWRDEYRTGIAKVSIDGTTIEIPIAFRVGSDITSETVKAKADKK
jgi:lipoprotein NlpI